MTQHPKVLSALVAVLLMCCALVVINTPVGALAGRNNNQNQQGGGDRRENNNQPSGGGRGQHNNDNNLPAFSGNCSEVFHSQCNDCRNSTALEDVTNCASKCVRGGRGRDFRRCRHDRNEFFGDRNVTGNCSKLVRQKCSPCFLTTITMEEKVTCLADCFSQNAQIATSDECGKHRNGTTTIRNCTEAFEQCSTCVGLVGKDRLKCLSRCGAVKLDRRCRVGDPSDLPGFSDANKACLAAIKKTCTDDCAVAEDAADQLTCLHDCIGGLEACQGRSQRDCLESICGEQCKRDRLRTCMPQCALKNAALITSCVAGL